MEEKREARLAMAAAKGKTYTRHKAAAASHTRKKLLVKEVSLMLFYRAIASIKGILHTLLSTGEQMDDIVFSTASDVFTRIETIYTWGIIKRVVMFSVFIGLFTNQFLAFYQTQAFVALDSSSGNCNTVPHSWTGKFYLDYNGNWQGLNKYIPQQAMYQIQLYDFSLSMTEYTKHMAAIQAALMEVGTKTVKSDLARNILYWASWSFTQNIVNSNKQNVQTTFIMAATPTFIMNNEGIQGTIASVNKDCSLLQSSQSYSLGVTGTFTTTFSSVIDMEGDGSCSNIINVKMLGYDKTVSGNSMSINLDITSLFTALAINNQINGASSFTYFNTIKEIARSKWPLFPKSQASTATEYVVLDRYDPQYPGMAPVTCVGPSKTMTTGVGFNCFLRVGKSYGIPFLSHKGDELDKPHRCDCSSGQDKTLCNKFDFIFGLAIFDHSAPMDHEGDGYVEWWADSTKNTYPDLFKPVIPLLETFVMEPAISGLDANGDSFDAAWSAIKGQECDGTQCLQCGTVYAWGTTSLTSDIVTMDSVANLEVGMTVTAISDTANNIIPVSTTILSFPTPTPTPPQVKLNHNANTAAKTLLKFSHTCSNPTRNVDFGDSAWRKSKYDHLKVSHYGVPHVTSSIQLVTSGAQPSTTSVTVATGSDTKLISAGWYVSGTNVPSGTKVSSISSVTITLTNAASAAIPTGTTLTFSEGKGGYASLIAFNSFSDLRQGITADNFQLVNGSCANSILSPNFNTAFTQAWGILEEVYFQCTMYLSDSIINAAGIAAGTAGLIVPTFFFTAMTITMAWVSYQHTMVALDKDLTTVVNLQSHDFDTNVKFTKQLTADQIHAHSKMDLHHMAGRHVHLQDVEGDGDGEVLEDDYSDSHEGKGESRWAGSGRGMATLNEEEEGGRGGVGGGEEGGGEGRRSGARGRSFPEPLITTRTLQSWKSLASPSTDAPLNTGSQQDDIPPSMSPP